MTKAEYARYEKRVAAFFKDEGITNLSPGKIVCSNCEAKLHESGCCDEKCPNCGADIECMNEPYFSWRPCECCGSTLGGNREVASAYHPESGNCFEYEICQDCIYYASYGRLDDMTMADMEE
jgi:hypothetical protein